MTVLGPNDPRAVSRTGEWAVLRNGEIVHTEATKELANEVMEVSQLNDPDAWYLVVPVARTKTLFKLDQVVVTAALHFAIQRQGLEPDSLVPYLKCHVSGDWGEVDKHDHGVNQAALKSGARILSAYDMPNIGRIWIITDAAYTEDVRKREVTTILFPSDY